MKEKIKTETGERVRNAEPESRSRNKPNQEEKK